MAPRKKSEIEAALENMREEVNNIGVVERSMEDLKESVMEIRSRMSVMERAPGKTDMHGLIIGSSNDICSLSDSYLLKHEAYTHEITCRMFSTQLQSSSKKNQIKRSSYVIVMLFTNQVIYSSREFRPPEKLEMANLLSDESTANSIITKVIIHVLNVQESVRLDGFQKDSKTSLFGPNGETDKILAKGKDGFRPALKGTCLGPYQEYILHLSKSWSWLYEEVVQERQVQPLNESIGRAQQPQIWRSFVVQTGYLDTSDRGSVQGGYLNIPKVFCHEYNFPGKPTQTLFTEAWNLMKIFTDEKVMNFLNRRFFSPSIREYQISKRDSCPRMNRPEPKPILHEPKMFPQSSSCLNQKHCKDHELIASTLHENVLKPRISKRTYSYVVEKQILFRKRHEPKLLRPKNSFDFVHDENFSDLALSLSVPNCFSPWPNFKIDKPIFGDQLTCLMLAHVLDDYPKGLDPDLDVLKIEKPFDYFFRRFDVVSLVVLNEQDKHDQFPRRASAGERLRTYSSSKKNQIKRSSYVIVMLFTNQVIYSSREFRPPEKLEMANLLSDESTANSIITKVIIHVLNVQESVGLDGFQKDSKTSLFGPNGETDKILAKGKDGFRPAFKGTCLDPYQEYILHLSKSWSWLYEEVVQHILLWISTACNPINKALEPRNKPDCFPLLLKLVLSFLVRLSPSFDPSFVGPVRHIRQRSKSVSPLDPSVLNPLGSEFISNLPKSDPYFAQHGVQDSRKRPYLYPVHPSGSDESRHLDWSSPQHTTFVLRCLALDRGYIKSHSASLDDPFNPSQFQKRHLLLVVSEPLWLVCFLSSFIFSSLHVFLFLFLGSGLFLYSLVIAYYKKKIDKKEKKKFWLESPSEEKSRGSGGREILLAEEKPSLRTVKADPFQKSLHLSFSFLYPTKVCFGMFGLLKKSKPQQDVYFPFKTVFEKEQLIFDKKQFASNEFAFVQKQKKRQNRCDDEKHGFSSGGPSGQSRKRPYLYPVHPSGSDESRHLDWSSPFSPIIFVCHLVVSQHTTFVLRWLALDRGYIKSHSASLDDPFNPSQFQKRHLLLGSYPTPS
ncbi:hypothetical protein IGI04_015417 [Brassica rapa subsp. trilocularis]|uniref:Uncharacterized protein n=1 Tax=Brassica rapa subsp. trilocularis TaxID=1813537 RepID=A0ABQ7MSH6_BRACM|nr:hypothetical protein IGI04_015417 [Brassica rapa subsp. trilocularis]